jgi:hypothetical protein
MLATFDLSAVRRFVAELDTRRAGCNGEGTFCSDLDETLGCHVAVCEELLEAVVHWAEAVFSDRVPFDSEVELAFKAELQRGLDEARPLVEYGREVETDCYSLERLDALERYVKHFSFLLKNWVRPQKSVAPGPRVLPSDAADKQILARITDLPPLPENWRPKDRRQARRFGRPPNS